MFLCRSPFLFQEYLKSSYPWWTFLSRQRFNWSPNGIFVIDGRSSACEAHFMKGDIGEGMLSQWAKATEYLVAASRARFCGQSEETPTVASTIFNEALESGNAKDRAAATSMNAPSMIKPYSKLPVRFVK